MLWQPTLTICTCVRVWILFPLRLRDLSFPYFLFFWVSITATDELLLPQVSASCHLLLPHCGINGEKLDSTMWSTQGFFTLRIGGSSWRICNANRDSLLSSMTVVERMIAVVVLHPWAFDLWCPFLLYGNEAKKSFDDSTRIQWWLQQRHNIPFPSW